jgi:hypothetical protein
VRHSQQVILDAMMAMFAQGMMLMMGGTGTISSDSPFSLLL